MQLIYVAWLIIVATYSCPIRLTSAHDYFYYYIYFAPSAVALYIIISRLVAVVY